MLNTNSLVTTRGVWVQVLLSGFFGPGLSVWYETNPAVFYLKTCRIVMCSEERSEERSATFPSITLKSYTKTKQKGLTTITKFCYMRKNSCSKVN